MQHLRQNRGAGRDVAGLRPFMFDMARAVAAGDRAPIGFDQTRCHRTDYLVRMIWPGSARGSRGSQRPASTCAMNSASSVLKAAGSSMFSV